MPGRRRRPTVERKIYFYRVDSGLDDAGRPLLYDPVPALSHVSTLPFTSAGRYWELDETVTCCVIDHLESPQRLRLINVRRSGLPQIEDGGSFSPLQLPRTSGLAETTHVVLFPGNIVGVEFNFYGPRAGRLGAYLGVKAAGHGPPISLQPLLRHDVATQLAQLADVRVLDLKIHASYASVVEQASQDLGNAFAAAARAGEAEIVELVLRPRPYSRGSLARRILSTVRTLGAREDLRENALRFVVRGRNGQTSSIEEVDVLRDQLISVKQIVRQDGRYRTLESESAYGAIEAAYEELSNEITAASAVST